MPEKETAMIELTRDQSQAIERGADEPTVVVDPQTGQHYRLIKEDVFKLMQGIVKPFNRGWEDDPDMDAYE
jgi:hypothetical protein